MMRDRTPLLLLAALLAACAANPDKQTLAELRNVPADVQELRVEDGLDKAIQGYRSYLEDTPESPMTPEAMRRLADLKVEKEYGILGDGRLLELPVPETAGASVDARARRESLPRASATAGESAAGGPAGAAAEAEGQVAFDYPEEPVPHGDDAQAWAGPLEAVDLYKQILATYPGYEHNDQVLYQMARAHDELGQTDEAIVVMDRLIAGYPDSGYIAEVQFRRAEYFFTRRKFIDAERAYTSVIGIGPGSEYYELALYKLGWTLYKQDFYDEALHKYVALLDYKVSTGYDFDQVHEEADERRVADTFRVISLSFSSLGGPEVVSEYFAEYGKRSYEDRIYRHVGEFYFSKLRYNDAAAVYKSFIRSNPLHKVSPHFGMRVIEIYEAGGFPRLVLESKKDFANTYGVRAEYWRHFDISESPEVLAHLKSNVEDLANHFHALYQDEALVEARGDNHREALHWYGEFLASFPDDEHAPAINYQLADLLLENQDFGLAALEYERTAYQYSAHAQAAAAGYAAIYAHREHQKAASDEARAEVRRSAVASTLRFAEAFPDHEHAPVVLGAAVDDLYDMREYELAIGSGHKLIDRYPQADVPILRAAWIAVAHSLLEIEEYEQAESAYLEVLALMAEDDEARQSIVDNLAASIYKQGERANLAEDHRLAANHFLRIRQVAPTSGIRAAAEYDAGAALMRLEDWAMAAEVLESFRQSFPEHELQREATRQIAFVYREDGQIARAAEEYERIATEADDADLARQSLLLAGELYEEAKVQERALAAYLRYVTEYPQPVEAAVETRFKIAGMYKAASDEPAYHEQLQLIVATDREAGGERTGRTKYLAAQSALVLSEVLCRQFAEVQLTQPFEISLQEKQRRMDAALEALNALVDYELGEFTAAATFYMAEVYLEFSRSLNESERPPDMDAVELADYEMAIEEEAFPFEERAIEVHEKNLELMVAGTFNPWTDKSLDKLADLMPGRYAKFEISSGFIGSMERYAYRSPGAADPGVATGEEAEAVPSADPTPPAGPGEEVGLPNEELPDSETPDEEYAVQAVAAG